MSTGDIMPYSNTGASKIDGALKYFVASGTTASIKAGEPVTKVAGAATVLTMATNGPTTTARIVGVASSVSNETASAAGTVDIIPANAGQIWLIAPNVAATWNTQAKYNALCGARVLVDKTGSVYTILAADGASNGCIVEWLDVARYPGQVAFSWSPLCDYRNV